MKILIIGGTGTIGTSVSNYLKSEEHEVITAGRNSGDLKVDITDSESIERLFEQSGSLDAVVSISGEAKWDLFENLSEDDFYVGIRSKMMGQVNISKAAIDNLNPEGSITLSTGILADDPVIKTTSAAMVNGAVNSFAQALALELKEGKRINVVSLGVVENSYEKYKSFFPGHNPVPTEKVINAYVTAILGKGNGQIIREY